MRWDEKAFPVDLLNKLGGLSNFPRKPALQWASEILTQFAGASPSNSHRRRCQIPRITTPPLAPPPQAQIHHETRLFSASPSIAKLTCISCSKKRPGGMLPLHDSSENDEDDNAVVMGRADSGETPSMRQALTAQVGHCSLGLEF
jgi:hypothetical protein